MPCQRRYTNGRGCLFSFLRGSKSFKSYSNLKIQWQVSFSCWVVTMNLFGFAPSNFEPQKARPFYLLQKLFRLLNQWYMYSYFCFAMIWAIIHVFAYFLLFSFFLLYYENTARKLFFNVYHTVCQHEFGNRFFKSSSIFWVQTRSQNIFLSSSLKYNSKLKNILIIFELFGVESILQLKLEKAQQLENIHEYFKF